MRPEHFAKPLDVAGESGKINLLAVSQNRRSRGALSQAKRSISTCGKTKPPLNAVSIQARTLWLTVSEDPPI
ncbi:MAG: hypothetical protein KDA37_18275 [Planctomycetales bacterium]|nr:hypothetical protein [Planctomycetales bacterium]